MPIVNKEMFGGVIRYDDELELYCATDLAKVASKHRIMNCKAPYTLRLAMGGTGIATMINQLQYEGVIAKVINHKGLKGTWVHRFVFCELARCVSVDFKIETYQRILAGEI